MLLDSFKKMNEIKNQEPYSLLCHVKVIMGANLVDILLVVARPNWNLIVAYPVGPVMVTITNIPLN